MNKFWKNDVYGSVDYTIVMYIKIIDRNTKRYLEQ